MGNGVKDKKPTNPVDDEKRRRQREYQKRYDQRIRSYYVSLRLLQNSESDKPIIDRLKEVSEMPYGSKQGYIKKLILQDIEKESSGDTPEKDNT